MRQRLPMGAYWPGGWLSFAARRLPLYKMHSDWEAIDWWLECPWTLPLAYKYPTESLRRLLIKKIPSDYTYIALAPEIVKLGGGAGLWQKDLLQAKMQLIIGLGLDLLAFASFVSSYRPKQVVLWLPEASLPMGLLSWLSQQTDFLVIVCTARQLEILELWQVKAVYETGIVVKLLVNSIPPVVEDTFFLCWDNLAQTWAQKWFFKGQQLSKQPRFLLRSQSRWLTACQAELLLCRDQPALWEKLADWQKEGAFGEFEQWLKQMGTVLFVR